MGIIEHITTFDSLLYEHMKKMSKSKSKGDLINPNHLLELNNGKMYQT